MALAGRVYCNVEATVGDVEPGDLLTTSVLPGYAMKVTDYEKGQGAVLGKAMQRLARGEKGQILVLVTLQQREPEGESHEMQETSAPNRADGGAAGRGSTRPNGDDG